MGYFLTTLPARPPPQPLASPKTHVPGSPVKERGHRFYSPGLGRWVSRDPLGERGGKNLHCFVINEAIGNYDILGMYAANYGPMFPPKPTTTCPCTCKGATVKEFSITDDGTVGQIIKMKNATLSTPSPLECYGGSMRQGWTTCFTLPAEVEGSVATWNLPPQPDSPGGGTVAVISVVRFWQCWNGEWIKGWATAGAGYYFSNGKWNFNSTGTSP